MQKDVLRENFFTAIAKLLASTVINRDLTQAKDMVADDPDLQSTLETLHYHYSKLEKTLPAFCKRYPTSPACKNLRK